MREIRLVLEGNIFVFFVILLYVLKKVCGSLISRSLLTLRFDICSELTAELEGLDMGLAVRMYVSQVRW